MAHCSKLTAHSLIAHYFLINRGFTKMKVFCTGFLLFFLINSSRAQMPGRFLTYSVKDGLSQSSVHAIHRDRDGLLWLGTQDGLNSFDGNAFTTYRYNEGDTTSISDQFILKIVEDKKGNLWIGTRNGLNFFNKYTRKFKRYYINEEEKHQFQSSYENIFLYNEDSLLIERDGLFLLEPLKGKFTKIIPPGNTRGKWIVSQSYKVWFVNEEKEVFTSDDWRKNNFIKIGLSDLDLTAKAFNYYSRTDTSVFIYRAGNKKLLYELDGKTFTIKNKLPAPAAINNVLLTDKGTLFIATSNGLLSKQINREPQFTRANLGHTGLPAGPVLTTFVDVDENLWIGTAGNGFSMTNSYFDSHQLINFPVANDRVQSICYNHNDLYLTSQSGLYKIKNFSLSGTTKIIEPVIKGKPITSVTADAAGNTWVAFYPGEILVLDKNDQAIKEYSISEKDKDLTVLKMVTSANGTVFICTNNGLYIKQPKKDEFIIFNDQSSDQLLGNYVLGVYEDYENNFWIANNQGVNILSSELKPLFSINSSDDKSSFIKRTIVTSVTQDLDSAYWIGTLRNGVYRYKNNKVSHYTHANGLASDVVYNVVCDSKNRIWISTSVGLSVFKREETVFNNLSEFEGVPNAAFSFSGVLKFGQHILYATSEGLLICDADKVELKNTDIEAYISDVKINGQSTPLQNQSFSLMPDNKLISFELAYTPALLSGNILYQYRVKELNQEWISLPPGVNSISYNGLPYKNLQMQVRAAGSINKLNDAKIYTVTINSYPPIQKTSVFFGGIVLLFSVIIFLAVVRYNQIKYKKQLQIIEVERTLQKERTRIGRDLHDNMGAYTSALLAGLNRIENRDEKETKLLTDLKIYGASIMGFLRETIWMLNAEKLTVTAFADRFKNYALRICKNYPEVDLQFRETIDLDKSLPPTIMLNLFRILQEGLQNACKHAQATKIMITIISQEKLSFSVQDNGVGFTKLELKDHYGLDNMKQRAGEAGFILELESNENGTNVNLSENTANG